jgi:predicted anti-sigma-YlaC factor YlaD
MDCERVQDLLSEFLDGSIPESGRADINAHIQECLPCRAAKEGLEETLLLLRGLPPAEAPPELLEGVRRGIARE